MNNARRKILVTFILTMIIAGGFFGTKSYATSSSIDVTKRYIIEKSILDASRYIEWNNCRSNNCSNKLHQLYRIKDMFSESKQYHFISCRTSLNPADIVKLNVNGLYPKEAGYFQKHTGGTHANEGICTSCGKKYQNHKLTTKWVSFSGSTHIKRTICSGCDYAREDTSSTGMHTGGTHANGGVCKICNYKYQTHNKTTKIVGYSSNGKTHSPLYECSHKGCSSRYTGAATNHTGATHKNGGKCTVCNKVYEVHTPSKITDGYDITTKYHNVKAKCTNSKCNENFKIKKEKHTGGTHKNGGKCTVCNHNYQDHSKTSKKLLLNYKMDKSGHIPVYKCSVSNCEKQNVGTKQNHTGGNHNSDEKKAGRCNVCGYKFRNHSKSDIKHYYIYDKGNHTIKYECTDSNCKETYEETERHTFENEVCIGCGYIKNSFIPDKTIDISINSDNSIKAEIAWDKTNLNPKGEIKISGSGQMKDNPFNNLILDENKNLYVKDIEIQNLEINSDVTNISNNAFDGLNVVGKINIPSSMVKIGDRAFKGLKISGIDFGNSVQIIGKNAFENCTNISEVTIGNNITEIEMEAFKGCTNLEHVYIQNDETVIGENAFKNCNNNLTIHCNENSRAYHYAIVNDVKCEANKVERPLIDISSDSSKTLTAQVEKEMIKVYNGTKYKITLTIDGSGEMKDKPLENMDIGTNYGNRITEIVINEGVTNIANNTFEDLYVDDRNITIPNTVTKIGDKAFKGIKKMSDKATTIVNINGNAQIGDEAFQGFNGLEELHINGSAKIGQRAFKNINALKTVAIYGNVTDIGDEAFAECGNLRLVIIPESVVNIGENVFKDCSDKLIIYGTKDSEAEKKYKNVPNIEFRYLEERSDASIINIGKLNEDLLKANIVTIRNVNPVLEYDDTTSDYKVNEKYASLKYEVNINGSGEMKENPMDSFIIDDVYIESLNFGEGLKNISESAFEGISINGEILIPSTVEEIKKEAFKDSCEIDNEIDGIGLNSVAIEGDTKIGESAFENSLKLESLVINGKATIEENAFKNCKNLRTIEVLNDVEEIADNAFEGCSSDLTVYCKKDTYIERYARDRNINVILRESISEIDDVAPTIEINYSTEEETTENVIVTITADEEIQPIEGWELQLDKKTIQKEYNTNKEETVIIKDIAGNEVEAKIKIDNIMPENEDNKEDGENNEPEDEESDGVIISEEELKPEEYKENYITNVKNNSREDSKSYSILPKTGAGRILLGTALVGIVLSTVLYIKYKKVY